MAPSVVCLEPRMIIKLTLPGLTEPCVECVLPIPRNSDKVRDTESLIKKSIFAGLHTERGCILCRTEGRGRGLRGAQRGTAGQGGQAE